MTVYLEFDAVVEINATYGGIGATVNNENGVRAALAEPAQTWEGRELYPTPWHKAACLLRGLSATQYFGDGNKRTAYICAETFLNLNGITLKPQKVIFTEVLVRGVAGGAVPLNKVAEWFATRRRWKLFVEGYIAPADDEASA